MEDVFAQKMTIEERIRLVREILLIRNPEIEELNFHYDNKNHSLSLKKNRSLTNIDPIKFLPIKHLDLSQTAITSLERIRQLKLKSLNLSNTYIVDLLPLARMPLEQLNINNTGVTEISILHKLPLKKLNILQTRVTQIDSLKSIKTLIEIKADWSNFPHEREFFKEKIKWMATLSLWQSRYS